MPSTAATPSTREAQRALAEVWQGLSRPQKELPAKFFYDERGSELFSAITELPEYYPTRCEREILESWMPAVVEAFEPGTLVELGAGSGEKTRIILRAMHALSDGRTYVPVDVSAAYLQAAAADLRNAFPRLTVRPVVADITTAWSLPDRLPDPTLVIFLGGTIGNFRPAEATALLRQVRRGMQSSDRFIVGVDLRKDPRVIERAYNDRQGVTAEFNLNMLAALNRRFDTTFDLDAFRHRAFYNAEQHRIEMHLVAREATRVTVPGRGTVAIDAGESVRTEISCKHDRESITAIMDAAGLEVIELRRDGSGRFALVEAVPARDPS